MTINGGNIIVNGNDDSLNAGEDNISVITINGGTITCDSGYADGEEGDGIDSNGWIVINGGYVTACANSKSQDSGLDSDLGIHINGGTVLASGNMYDEIAEDSQQAFTVFRFSQKMTEEDIIVMTDENGNAIKAFQAVNDYTIMIYSSDDLVEGTYQLWKTTSVEGTKNGGIYTDIISYGEAIQLQYNTSAEMMGQKDFGNGAQKPTGEAPEQDGKPEGNPPEQGKRPTNEMQEQDNSADANKPERGERPIDEGQGNGPKLEDSTADKEAMFSSEFVITTGKNQFSMISTK